MFVRFSTRVEALVGGESDEIVENNRDPGLLVDRACALRRTICDHSGRDNQAQKSD